MAATTTAAARAAREKPKVKEYTFVWEGRDRAGKTLKGETRASGETVVVNTLRRQGIVVTRIKKQRYKARAARSRTRTSRCSPASWQP